MKYTKGPWQAVNNGHYWDIKPVSDCQALASTQENEHIGIDGEVEEANAHLIAAAPDMYEALEWVCDECGNELRLSCRGCPVHSVLAKARGE